MEERKKQILKCVQEKMKEWEIESLYRVGKEENLPMDILTILMNEFGNDLQDVLGEFFFLPKVEGRTEDALCFQCVLTLQEDLPEEMLPQFYEVVASLNYITEAGGFAISRSGRMLAYRNCLTLPLETADATVVELIMANITHSINVGEKFAGVIAAIRSERISMDEFRELFPA